MIYKYLYALYAIIPFFGISKDFNNKSTEVKLMDESVSSHVYILIIVLTTCLLAVLMSFYRFYTKKRSLHFKRQADELHKTIQDLEDQYKGLIIQKLSRLRNLPQPLLKGKEHGDPSTESLKDSNEVDEIIEHLENLWKIKKTNEKLLRFVNILQQLSFPE